MTTIQVSDFGTLRTGEPCRVFEMDNGELRVRILELGGTVQSLCCRDRAGKMDDVVLGYDTLAEYEENPAYFGCIVGRVANRIRDGRFPLNGREYVLAQNCGKEHSHGGVNAFHKKLWRGEIIPSGGGQALRLSLHSPDGDEGYPGALDVTATYALVGGRLILSYAAKSDADTIVNLTNHSYFNLAGQGNGTVLSHLCMIGGDYITATDERQIPTGELMPVKNTPFDFTDFHTIGARIHEADRQLEIGLGYDHNYALRKPSLDATAAAVIDPVSERKLTLYTDMPGVQFYTANTLGPCTGKGGAQYGPYAGFCLETQFFPGATRIPSFPSMVLRAGETYDYTTIYKFSTI